MALALSVAAPAATLGPFSDTFSLTGTPWSGFLALPAFDSNLGTLNSVLLELTGSVSANILVSSPTSTGNFSAGASTTVDLSDPLFNPALSVNPSGSQNGSLTVPGEIANIGINASASTSTLINSPALLAAFQAPGGGTLFLPISATGAVFGSGQFQPFTLVGTTQASGTGSVTYNYTPSDIPEPGTWAMMITGVALVGLARLRRKA